MPEVILIGPPGSGKSTIGKSLSKLLNLPFSDTDHLIEERAGKKISEIFVDEGESIFRAMEVEVVAQALQEQNGILALGGGSIMNPLSEALIASNSALKVFLEVGIAQAAPRIGFNQDRPLLLVNPRQTWLNLMKERKLIYKRLADVTLSTDSKKPADVAQEIQTALRSRSANH